MSAGARAGDWARIGLSNEAQQLYLLKLGLFLNVTKGDCVRSEFFTLLSDIAANKTMRIR